MGFVYLITIADRYNLFSQSRRFTGRASYNINFISPIIQFGVNKTEQDRTRQKQNEYCKQRDKVNSTYD